MNESAIQYGHERKWKVEGLLVNDKPQLPIVPSQFRTDGKLNSIADATVAAWEALADEQMEPYSWGGIASALLSAVHEGGDQNFWHRPDGLFTGLKQRRMVLDIIQSLVR